MNVDPSAAVEGDAPLGFAKARRLAVLGAGIVGALLSLPILSWPFGHDQAIFATIADAMLHGSVLYRDAWEHKGPGVFCTMYVGFLLFGHDLWAVHALEILGIALGSAALMKLGEERLGSRIGGAVSAVALPMIYLGFGYAGSNPEGFAIPFVLWGFALWPKPGDRASLLRRCAVAGAVLSVAPLFKSPMIFAPILLLLDRLWIDRRHPGVKAKLRLTLVTAAGIAGIPCLVVAYYALRGGWAAFIDANLHFPSKYAAPSLGALSLDSAPHAFGWVRWLLPLPVLVLVLLGIFRGFALRPGETLRWLLAFGAGWAGVVLQAKFWPYHHLLMIPYAAALPALAFCEAPASPGGRLHRWTLGIAGLLAGLSLVVYLRERRSEWSSLGTVATRNVPDGLPDPIPQDPTEVDVARCIRALSGPDDRLFVFGDRAVLYLLSDRRLAGLYPHLLPALAWFLGPETGPRLWSLIERVGRDHPRVVVTTPDILWWYGSHTPKVILDQFPDAKQFLLDGYRPSRRLGGYELWVAKD